MKKKQFLSVLAILLTAMASWGQTLNIGGHRAPLDTLNNTWLCSIPQSQFGSDFEAVVSFDESIVSLFIEDSELQSGDSYVFTGIEGGKQYPVVAMMGDSIMIGNITFTWLPVVELTGTFGNDYTRGYVTVSEPDSAYAEPLFAKVKWRGGATNVDGRHKRNYHIKFLSEEDTTKENHRFFGLRNDNSWILDAGQIDFLRIRNRINTDLWLDMARKPWYADTVANVRNGSRGQMVEVLLNGAYVGIYNMCEPIDRKQLKLERYEIDERNRAIIHGVIWKASRWSRTVNMSNPIARAAGALTWDGFEFKYPEWEDVRSVHWKSLEDAVWFANRADTNFALRDSMGYYFDLPVMQDYYIFIVALQALDNECTNIYYAVRDFRENRRLTMVPWDLDISLGQNYSPSVDLPDMVSPERYPEKWISHLPMADMFEVKWYYNELLARYRELRQTYLNTDSLVNRFRTAIDELQQSGAAAREEARWSGDTDLAGKELNLSAEMDYVEDWIRRRMTFLDENVFVPRIDGDVNKDGEVNIADVNCLIDVILGYTDPSTYLGRAYVNDDYEVNIADVNTVIDIILKN